MVEEIRLSKGFFEWAQFCRKDRRYPFPRINSGAWNRADKPGIRTKIDIRLGIGRRKKKERWISVWIFHWWCGYYPWRVSISSRNSWNVAKSYTINSRSASMKIPRKDDWRASTHRWYSLLIGENIVFSSLVGCLYLCFTNLSAQHVQNKAQIMNSSS